jgi:hypothetical protein
MQSESVESAYDARA